MHGSFLHCFIASQHNRQLQLQRRALLFNSLHKGAHTVAQLRSDVLIAAGRSVASFPVTTKGTFVGCLGQAGEVLLLP
jgi:hypothetical protein